MEVSVSGQLYVFFTMLLGGALSGVLSDVFMLFRRQMGNKRITTGIADLVLWVVLASGVFALNLKINNGELRWYGICALIFGAMLYFLVLSSIVRAVLGRVFAIVAKILLLIFKIVLTIATFLYKILFGVFMFLRRCTSPFVKGARLAGNSIGRSVSQVRLVLRKK